MKGVIVSITMLVSLSLSAQVGGGIRFDTSHTWSQIKRQAQTESKYIFIDVFTTWCGPCKMMDESVYKNDTVIDFMNDKFISVKMQMDSTKWDNEYVSSWYNDAKHLGEQHKIQGFPSYLFFTPQGQLVMQDIAYKDVANFINMAKTALEPKRLQFSSLVSDYKKGIKNYSILGELAVFTKDIQKDMDLASGMARDYKLNYLDKADIGELRNPGNLHFITQFGYLVNTRDYLFKLFLVNGHEIDSIVDIKGWSEFQVREAITRDEITAKLIKNGKPISKPDWDEITRVLKKKYRISNPDMLVLEQKIKYYRFYQKDWSLWAGAIEDKLKEYPVANDGGSAVFFQLNMPAWDVFLHCNEKPVLIKALRWSDLSIKLEQPVPNVQYLDTRAQLLYKLGRIDEAILQEERAVDVGREIARRDGVNVDSYIKEMQETASQMRRRERTWPINK